MAKGPHRPSDVRRKALHEELSVPLVSNFFPIERYYDAADKVYESFQQAFAASKDKGGKLFLDDAYVYGKRYCLFCIDAIPQHNYYSAAKNRSLQVRHHRQVSKVITQLEKVAELMDAEEVERGSRRLLALQHQEEERERKRQEQDLALQRRVERLRTQPGSHGRDGQPREVVQASALSKLELLRQPMKNGVTGVPLPDGQRESSIRRDPSGEEPQQAATKRTSSRYGILDDSSDEEGTGMGSMMPPPVLPPGAANGGISNGGLPPPPSYQQIQSHRQFLGPAEPSGPVLSYTTPSAPSAPHLQQQQQQRRPKVQKRIPMRQLQSQYQQEYARLLQQGKVQVRGLPTYQGRVDSSTNGCTVISALVAARHLSNRNDLISDAQIATVIDRECGPILRLIRSKLGLGGHALIIPSDVHDHLVDAKILRQADFEGAAGGNILDEDHASEFCKLLSVGEGGKGGSRKAAATLFFREHVISIVKRPNSQQFDWIDSLPSNGGGGSNGNGRLQATRTTFVGLDALRTHLRWYAARKFTDQHCSYVDRNAWDDKLADFDPRVFQGFVWMVK